MQGSVRGRSVQLSTDAQRRSTRKSTADWAAHTGLRNSRALAPSRGASTKGKRQEAVQQSEHVQRIREPNMDEEPELQ